MKAARPELIRVGKSAWRALPVVIAVAGAWTTFSFAGGTPDPAPAAPQQPENPWVEADLLAPAALARELAGPAAGERPCVLCVGFPPLYRGAHIPGATLAGPASRPEGIAALKRAVQNLAPTRPIVIYCGCCPIKDCPNLRPAFRTLRDLGFRQIRVLELPNNFPQDWSAKGFPVQKGDDPH